MSHLKEFRFNSALGMERVEAVNAVIHGVSIITCGVQAVGHELHVDGTTLDQMLSCAVAKGKVPVKYNHQSGVENVGGYLFNFRRKDNKLLADWQLMKAHKETPATLEKAQTMPECFGLSAAFMGKEAEKGGKKFARCTQLLAVDCVAQPAANPDGLFSVPVDTRKAGIMSDNLDPNQTEQAPAWFTQWSQNFENSINDRFGALESFQNTIQEQAIIAQLDAADPAEIEALTDDQLAELGLTREGITSYLADRAEAEGGDPNAQPSQVSPNAQPGAPGGQPTAPAAPAVAALSAQVQKLINLEAKRQANEKHQLAAAEEAEFTEALTALQEKQAALIELSAQQAAHIEKLELAAKTARYVAPSIETPNLFSAGEKDGEFETLVTAKFNALTKAGGITELAAKAEAQTFVIHRHPHAYAEWQARGRKPLHLEAK